MVEPWTGGGEPAVVPTAARRGPGAGENHRVIDSPSTRARTGHPQGEAAAVSIRRIQELVSERFGLSLDELCGDRRSQNIVYPRQVAMYLSRELTDSSLPKIGKEFGGRDHTTVIHATSKIARLIKEDRSVWNLVQELTARIKQVR